MKKKIIIAIILFILLIPFFVPFITLIGKPYIGIFGFLSYASISLIVIELLIVFSAMVLLMLTLIFFSLILPSVKLLLSDKKPTKKEKAEIKKMRFLLFTPLPFLVFIFLFFSSGAVASLPNTIQDISYINAPKKAVLYNNEATCKYASPLRKGGPPVTRCKLHGEDEKGNKYTFVLGSSLAGFCDIDFNKKLYIQYLPNSKMIMRISNNP